MEGIEYLDNMSGAALMLVGMYLFTKQFFNKLEERLSRHFGRIYDKLEEVRKNGHH